MRGSTLMLLRAAIANGNQADRPNVPWWPHGAEQMDEKYEWQPVSEMKPSYNRPRPRTRERYVKIALDLWDTVIRNGFTTC